LHIPDHLADGAEIAENIAGIDSNDSRTTT